MPSRVPRRPRASFVVTISIAAAALAGCGGQVQGSGDGDPIPDPPRNPPFEAGVPDTSPDAPTGCPKTQPNIGDRCSGVTYCDYSSCGVSGSSGKTFQCIDARFQEGGTPTCNPPPVCPPEEPVVGTPCATGGFGGCSYPDRCADRPADAPSSEMLYCSGKWAFMGTTGYVATCPASPPVNGSSCRCGNHSYGSCRYGTCGLGSGPTVASCDTTTGLWLVGTETCNPPGPGVDAGSAEAGSGSVDGGAAP
jgi:hypothetical protein